MSSQKLISESSPYTNLNYCNRGEGSYRHAQVQPIGRTRIFTGLDKYDLEPRNNDILLRFSSRNKFEQQGDLTELEQD